MEEVITLEGSSELLKRKLMIIEMKVSLMVKIEVNLITGHIQNNTPKRMILIYKTKKK